MELLRAQCSRGRLSITENVIAVELLGARQQILYRSALTGIDVKWRIISFFGIVPSHSITFRGQGAERLHAGRVRKKTVREIMRILR